LEEQFGPALSIQDSFRLPHPSGYRDLTAVFESKAGLIDGGDPIDFTITI